MNQLLAPEIKNTVYVILKRTTITCSPISLKTEGIFVNVCKTESEAKNKIILFRDIKNNAGNDEYYYIQQFI